MKPTHILKKGGQQSQGPFIENSQIGSDFLGSASDEIRAEFAI